MQKGAQSEDTLDCIEQTNGASLCDRGMHRSPLTPIFGRIAIYRYKLVCLWLYTFCTQFAMNVCSPRRVPFVREMFEQLASADRYFLAVRLAAAVSAHSGDNIALPPFNATTHNGFFHQLAQCELEANISRNHQCFNHCLIMFVMCFVTLFSPHKQTRLIVCLS